MPYLETCLLIAETDRVLCHLLMILTVYFHWICKMKYSCYQEYFVIHGWFVYWILVKNAPLVGNPISESIVFRNEPTHFTLLEKFQAILVLSDGFQELHLDW